MIARSLKSNKSNRNAPLLELGPVQPSARPQVLLGALLPPLIGVERAGIVESVGSAVFSPALGGLGALLVDRQRRSLPRLHRLLGALLRRLLRGLLLRLAFGPHREPFFTPLLLKLIDAQRPLAGELRLPQELQISFALRSLEVARQIQNRLLDHLPFALEPPEFGGLLEPLLGRGQGLHLQPFADLGLYPPPLHARHRRPQVR